MNEAVTADTGSRLTGIRRAFQRRWFQAAERFRARVARDAGARAAATKELEQAWKAAIDTGWKEAYRHGFAVRSRVAPEAWPDELLSSIRSQQEFATRFARDVAAGRPSHPFRMSVGPRTNLYANALGGAYHQGFVQAGDDGEVIFWMLGTADHCGDCPALAASGPYSRNGEGGRPILPCYPRSGATECRSSCRCFLEIHGGAGRKTRQEEPPPFVDRALTAPPPPEGLRRPDRAETLQIADMEARVNYARRMISQTAGTPAQETWVAARREASQRLREFQERMGVHSPPRFSVGEVVTGKDITAAEVNHLTTIRGLDGRTINRASAERARKALDAERARLKDELAALPPETPDVSVPDLRAMLIRAGAPPELLPEALDALPAPATYVINGMGMGGRATVEQHFQAVAVLANDPYDLDVGPLDDDWFDLVLVGGTWISGPAPEVRRFLTAWVGAGAKPAIAPWRPT